MSMSTMNHQEIASVISEESQKFAKRAAGTILGRYVSNLTMKVIGKVDSSFESESLKNLLIDNFKSSILPNVGAGCKASLENGAVGGNLIESVSNVIHKYVAQESYYRSNDLKKQLLMKMTSTESAHLDRKAIIAIITNAFESDELQLELSEGMNEEVEATSGPEEGSIVDGASKEVVGSIEDAEEKAEVTRTVIKEYTDVSDKLEEQQKAMEPDPEAAAEAARFDSTAFIKARIPVTAQGFALESAKGSFTKKKLVDMLLTLEDNGSYKEDVEYIGKRVEAIRRDATDIRGFDGSSLDAFEKIFSSAKGEVDGVFSAFRQIGFGRGDLPAAERDADTLNVIAKMANLRTKDEPTRINDIEILLEKDVTPIETAEEMLNVAFESFELKSAFASDVSDYDKYQKAIELRDELVGEFLIDGLAHVPEARIKRLRNIQSGLTKVANNDGLRQFNPNRLKSIYYKTAQVIAPDALVDFKSEASRVKEMISKTYNTDGYSEIVDDFFSGKQTSSHLSEENLYELFAYKSAMEITTESGGITAIDRRNVKAYAAVHSCYYKTLENLGLITKQDIKKVVKANRK